MRENNPTFSSNLFSPTKDKRPVSRQDEKWKSSIFEEPKGDENTVKRRKLGGYGAGTEALFGKEKVDFDNKTTGASNLFNNNKKETKFKKWGPIRKEKTAEQRKNEMLYGDSVRKHGVGKKKDGTLKSNGNDWMNPQQNQCNSPVKAKRDEQMTATSRDQKFANLESNIFNEERDNRGYDKEVKKGEMEGGSNWVQSGSTKCVNKGSTKVDTYQKRQAQLNSNVFDLPEYADHVPMKKKRVDMNNLTDNQRKKDHMYSDILGSSGNGGKAQKTTRKKTCDELHMAGNQWSTPNTKQMKKDYSGYLAKNQKKDQLRSSLDTHTYPEVEYQVSAANITPEKPNLSLNVKQSKATKLRDLSSNILGVSDNLQQHFDADNNKNTVVDLDLKNLPRHAD